MRLNAQALLLRPDLPPVCVIDSIRHAAFDYFWGMDSEFRIPAEPSPELNAGRSRVSLIPVIESVPAQVDLKSGVRFNPVLDDGFG